MSERTTIYTLGYPKSGTTWLSRLLGDALNSPVGALFPPNDHLAIATEGQDRPGPYYIRQGHATPVPDYPAPVVPDEGLLAYRNLTNQRIVIMVRHPFDVAVSVQHHWGMDSLCTAVGRMVDGEWPLGIKWAEWVESWHAVAEQTDMVWTRYELLSQFPHAELDSILVKLGVSDVEGLGDIVARQSFTARREWTELHGDDLNYGKEYQLRFLRKGIVGDWHNHDWTGCYELAMGAWGDTMKALGYDTN